MEPWNSPASAPKLPPVEVEDPRSHNWEWSQCPAGLRTVQAGRLPLPGSGFLLFIWLEMKSVDSCLVKRIDRDIALWGCLCPLFAGCHSAQWNSSWPGDCQAPFSFFATSASSCDKPKTHRSGNPGSFMALPLKSILEMSVGSGCQVFNSAWEEEEWEKSANYSGETNPRSLTLKYLWYTLKIITLE